MTDPSATTVRDPRLDVFVEQVGDLIDRHHRTGLDERALTRDVADLLRQALADGIELPGSVTRPGADRYVTYPLHVDPDGRFSVASAVWNVGQGTPVHGHETWGVVGIHSGVEHEISFAKPAEGQVPVRNGEEEWSAGQVTVCCTTDDDVHQVFCGGDQPCVGIHVYGADIGNLPRRSYDPETGQTTWFTSTWSPIVA